MCAECRASGDPSVADILAFERRPREERDSIIRALRETVGSDEWEEGEEAGRETLREAYEQKVKRLRAEIDAAGVALNIARDVTRPRDERMKKYAELQTRLVTCGTTVDEMEAL